MRLIDADAEISKIETEIEQTRDRIKEWEENRADRSLYDVDEKIRDLNRNIIDAKTEIKMLKRYVTACDVDKVVEQMEDYLFEKYCIEGDSKIEEIMKGRWRE